MSKRKLTRKQAWRIEKIQQERTARAKKREDNTQQAAIEGKLGPEQQGLVIAHYGTQVAIESSALPGTVRRCHLRTHLGSLVTGDHVIWRDSTDSDTDTTHGVVVAVLPRTSALSRPDPYGEMKTIAANIDRIMVVIAPLPKPENQLIDRYLVAAEALDIRPVIVFNKWDLVDDSNRDNIDELIQLYRGLGYELINASTTAGQGLEQLADYLKQVTSVFVGQSGVGKSSLVNALLPDANIAVGAISEATQKGTHTTTTAKLFHLPQGGQLIDSPGIREFGLWHMSAAEILEGFIELRPFIGHCRFRDCRHQQEPGCAIIKAYEQGIIGDKRMASYRHLRNSPNDNTRY